MSSSQTESGTFLFTSHLEKDIENYELYKALHEQVPFDTDSKLHKNMVGEIAMKETCRECA